MSSAKNENEYDKGSTLDLKLLFQSAEAVIMNVASVSDLPSITLFMAEQNMQVLDLTWDRSINLDMAFDTVDISSTVAAAADTTTVKVLSLSRVQECKDIIVTFVPIRSPFSSQNESDLGAGSGTGAAKMTGTRVAPAMREDVVNYIAAQKLSNPNYKVIDIGGSYLSWSWSVIDYIVDYKFPKKVHDNIHYFTMNINYESEWEELLDHVKAYGKFDFAICSHTLEDISTPMVPAKMMGRVAKAGFIAIPSKFAEFDSPENPDVAGYIHHRWIFTLPAFGGLMAYPKVNFFESAKTNFKKDIGHDESHFQNSDKEDLAFYWENSVDLEIVNEDYLGPSESAVKSYYTHLYADESDVLLLERNNNIIIQKILEGTVNLPTGYALHRLVIENRSLSDALQESSSQGWVPYAILHSKRSYGRTMSVDVLFNTRK